LILDHLNENQFLIANEIVDNRNAILRENLTKWGFPNFAVTQNDAKQFGQMTDYFDAIFVDAQCSGEGLFRKDEKDEMKRCACEAIYLNNSKLNFSVVCQTVLKL